ncbi:MAG: heat-inducible transcriptional repressor HrcA [Gammaproteobacteria bacterium]|nr:heat-inducible transcriptional repressor HrcA [Gammaproteobacteria bacterium]
MTEELNERAALLLKKLVYSYIADGQPVGSKKLSDDADLNISSATIRNVMSGLEKKGLIVSPHTSAGRIPTEQGYRLFVDTMLETETLSKSLLTRLKNELDPDQNKDALINHASQMVSELTHMAGIITVPKASQATLRHIEFLPLSDQRILAIMVINEREVQNRVLHMQRSYTTTELLEASNFLNQSFSGRDIYEVREILLTSMQETRRNIDAIMQTAIEVADATFSESLDSRDEYLVQGETNLVRFGESYDTDQLKQLLEVFDHKREMLGLLDRCIQADGVKVFIGNETGFKGLGDCSVITAPYTVKGEPLGVLGVIGPARINYNVVIPVVDVTAKLLGEALNK